MQLSLIENLKEYKDLLKYWEVEDSFIDVIPLDDNIPYCKSLVSLIFIRIISTGNDYIIPLRHSESTYNEFDLSLLENSQTKKYTIDKKKIIQLMPVLLQNVCDLNIELFICGKEMILDEKFDTQSHNTINNKFYNYKNLNNIIPILKHYEKFKSIVQSINSFDISDQQSFDNWNDKMITSLSTIESNGLKVDENLFLDKFNEKLIYDGFVYSQYNIYTSTSRPSNRFGGVNYAALNKENGSRNCFISRFGDNGGLLSYDYSAFHPVLIGQLVGHKIPFDVYAYDYLGKFFFGKDELTKDEISESKKIVFKLIYGGITKEFLNIPYFNSVSDYIDLIWDVSNERGYAETPYFKRKIYLNTIEENNKNKLFNYVIQAAETENNVGIMYSLNSYLKYKKTKLVLYTYDSFTFDLSNEDGDCIIGDLKQIIEDNKTYPVKSYFGKNYGEMKLI